MCCRARWTRPGRGVRGSWTSCDGSCRKEARSWRNPARRPAGCRMRWRFSLASAVFKTHVRFRSNEIKPCPPPANSVFLFSALGSNLGAADLTWCSSCFLLHAQLLPLEEDLRQCRREQQEAQQRCRQLEKKAEELDERNASAAGERERHVKLLEARASGSAHASHTFAALRIELLPTLTPCNSALQRLRLV